MHAMIDLHISSKYKVANTFNKEGTGTMLPTLEVKDCRYSIRHCQMHPAASLLSFYQILIFLVLPKNCYFPCNI